MNPVPLPPDVVTLLALVYPVPPLEIVTADTPPATSAVMSNVKPVPVPPVVATPVDVV